jgi:hypothetical protein
VGQAGDAVKAAVASGWRNGGAAPHGGVRGRRGGCGRDRGLVRCRFRVSEEWGNCSLGAWATCPQAQRGCVRTRADRQDVLAQSISKKQRLVLKMDNKI